MLAAEGRIHGGQDAAINGEQMRIERYGDVLTSYFGNLLLDLRGMAMGSKPVRLEGVMYFAEERADLGATPCTGGTRLGIDDDILGADQTGRQGRRQPENGRCRITTGIGDQPRTHNLIKIQFGQSVYGLSQIFRLGVLGGIPLFIRGLVIDAEIG